MVLFTMVPLKGSKVKDSMPVYLQIRRSGRTRKRNALYSDEFVMPKACKKVGHVYIKSSFKTVVLKYWQYFQYKI